MNSIQVRYNAYRNLKYLETQYLNATYEIYKNALIGDILVGRTDIEKSLVEEISDNRKVGVILKYRDKIIRSGSHAAQSPIAKYKLNLGNQEFAELELYPIKRLRVFNLLSELLVPLAIEILVLVLGFIYLLRKINRNLLAPLNSLFLNLEPSKINSFTPNKDAVHEIVQLSNTVKNLQAETSKKAQFEAEAIAAKQVAHDIRSPLACLNLLLSNNTENLPEKQRIMMRSSIQRITDIANTLQSRAIEIDERAKLETKEAMQKDTPTEKIMLASLISSVVTEKRAQIGINSQVHIDIDISKGCHLFVEANSAELKRVFSNLLDNSIEACSANENHILLSLTEKAKQVNITVTDDGCGIPQNILNRIGTFGFSYNKSTENGAGSGIGMHHAIKTIESFHGKLIIESKLNIGTTVAIKLPKAIPPTWFIGTVDLSQTNTVVILDDDESIHHLWNDKLETIEHRIKITHFCKVTEFNKYLKSQDDSLDKTSLFLLDFELVGQNTTGLELIKQHNLGQQAILVTSHHEDREIQAEAKHLQLRIIPKGIVPYVPILHSSSSASSSSLHSSTDVSENRS